jgi:hypothetical protein
MQRFLNSSVDHGCNMSIKMIRFMKGWTVAWIQNKVSFGLCYFRKGLISIYWSMFCVLWWSWSLIDTLKYFIHKVQYIVMPLCKIMFAENKRLLLVAAVHHIWLFVYMWFQWKVFQTWAKEWGCRHKEREKLFDIEERRVQHFLSLKGLLDL